MVPECALEFMKCILDHLEPLPQYLTTYEEVGNCALCGTHYRQVCIFQYDYALPLHYLL